MALIAMAGLPGAGKSTVADALARDLRAPVLSVDPIEGAMWAAGIARDQPTGLAAYFVADALARTNLALGLTVIIDAVNAAEPARWMWREMAASVGVPLRFIEVVCSDEDVHRRRLAARTRKIAGFESTPWSLMESARAEWAPWSDERLVLDSCAEATGNMRQALEYVK